MQAATKTIARRRSAEAVAHMRAAMDSGRVNDRQHDRLRMQVASAERRIALENEQGAK